MSILSSKVSQTQLTEVIYQQNIVVTFLYLVQLDEDTIVDLQQTEQLQHLADLGVHLVHTGYK